MNIVNLSEKLELSNKIWCEIVEKLIKQKLTISVMESCTGGGVANEITNISGASSVIKESYVTYSNEAKIKQGVSKGLIEQFTVYSKQVAIEMAKVVKEKSGSNIGIGVTGQLGRIDPANPVDKLNVVWFSIINENNDVIIEEIHVPDCERNEQKLYVIEKIAECLKNILT